MSKDNVISEKQKQILDFIIHATKTKGYPPSVREICKAVGLKSTSTVHGHLERLEKKGYIRRDPTKPRAIEITSKNYENISDMQEEIINIPVVGTIAAGQPILAVESTESKFPIPANMFPGKNTMFILTVKGDSMIECGIYSGDYVIIEQTPEAENGDIVAALIDDSATIKRFYKENDHIRLQPENSHMKPIIVHNCKILGKAIGLFRKL